MIEATASYPFPVLGPMRMDYRDDCVYETHDWKVESENVSLKHRIGGSGLVADLVKSGEAAFAVAVVMKATMYRKTFIAKTSGELSALQNVPIEKGNRSIELPMFFPMVIYRGKVRTLLASKSMGLDEFWLGREFSLHRGAIIARDQEYQFLPGRSHLLRLRRNDQLAEGEIRVSIADADSGYFLVEVHPALYGGISNAQTQGTGQIDHRNSILTHALSVGFAKLAAEIKDGGDGYKTLENFQAVKRALEESGIPTWEHENFDACMAACFQQPHRLNSGTPEEDSDV